MRISKGSNVYIRSPQSVVADCVSITGDVVSIVKRPTSTWAVVSGYVAKMGSGHPIEAAFRLEDLGVRIGTPISQLSGRPGHPGYDRFKTIAASWGYP